ncbi:dTDP-4-dehydrorhamnose 3,5-epimerase [Falsiroseomonas tokyonensis]|uniref:dTDP-4-dehydrorhamnose 3,5-epimerase n=1 Tax=Falsiroseomonas tokyonensis TaxID=430521 RepID=A0ABV7BZG1_9PROT|nr:dTDP-4-dehydrorhamnose 3,5-epimerase [Falsiroseomonas tokyonensis]MBU8539849.1 dTDP-4-dehydrorhamnose 3,5-epimerase [Falsiroseomonas tokyonensis]
MPDGIGPPAAEVRRAGNVEAAAFAIEGPLLVSVRRFADARGAFVETYSRRDFAAIGIGDEFVQDNQSLSVAIGTVRGLHFQVNPHAQGKLIRVLRGRILDVAVDLRAASPSFGRHVAVELSAADGRMMWVPPGFAHGFATREEETEVAYKVTALYAPDCDRSLAWDDPALGIDWGLAGVAATLSDKDRRAPRLADLGPAF